MDPGGRSCWISLPSACSGRLVWLEFMNTTAQLFVQPSLFRLAGQSGQTFFQTCRAEWRSYKYDSLTLKLQQNTLYHVQDGNLLQNVRPEAATNLKECTGISQQRDSVHHFGTIA